MSDHHDEAAERERALREALANVLRDAGWDMAYTWVPGDVAPFVGRVLAAANDRTIGWQRIAEVHGSAKDAAESDRDRLAAEVERLTRERDEALAATADWRERMVQREVAAQCAPIEAERDRLAATLAEVREAVVELYAADNAAQDEQDFRGHVGKANGRRFDAAHANLRRIVDATPADLATARDARVRAAALQAAGAAWAIAAPDRQVDSSALVEVVDRIMGARKEGTR